MWSEMLIPITLFGAAFGIVWVIISARNRERMAMIEKGVTPNDFLTARQGTSQYTVLKWALLLVGVGLGIFVGSLLETYTSLDEGAAYFAFALLFGGLGLVVAFLVTRKGQQEDSKG